MIGHTPVPQHRDAEFPVLPFEKEALNPISRQDVDGSRQAASMSLENAALLLALTVATGCLLAGLPLVSCAASGFAIGSFAGIAGDALADLIDHEVVAASYPRKVRRS